MKVGVFVALLVASTAVTAQTAEPEWVLAGETRKPYLSCNQPRDYGDDLHWTEPVIHGSGSQGIENEGEIDGRVMYEGNEYMTVVEWTKPVHDRLISKLVIHLSASDMAKRSTIRVGTQILINGGTFGYGGEYWVYASSAYQPSPVGALISRIVNEDRYQDFDLKLKISNGANCYDEPVTYHFRRVR